MRFTGEGELALDGAHHRKLWFVTLAERLGVSPLGLALAVSVAFILLTPAIVHWAGPIQYIRKPFEPFVPYLMAPSLLLFVGILKFGESGGALALHRLRSHLRPGIDIDPTRHPAAASWIGGLGAAVFFFPVHEFNTARWTRFLSGDWNLFDPWVVILVAIALVIGFQTSAAMVLLARRMGQLGSHLSLDLFDRSRGEPLARFSLRLALLVATFGVFQGLSAITGTWSFWPGVGGAVINFLTCGILLGLCTLPFVRSMRALKRAELLRVHGALAGDPDALDGSPLHERLRGLNLTELLAYRREVIETSIWPLDAALWGRWVFYIVLPPLSWVAAALVEQVVQAALPG